jgi:hypothetical protein
MELRLARGRSIGARNRGLTPRREHLPGNACAHFADAQQREREPFRPSASLGAGHRSRGGPDHRNRDSPPRDLGDGDNDAAQPGSSASAHPTTSGAAASVLLSSVRVSEPLLLPAGRGISAFVIPFPSAFPLAIRRPGRKKEMITLRLAARDRNNQLASCTPRNHFRQSLRPPSPRACSPARICRRARRVPLSTRSP